MHRDTGKQRQTAASKDVYRPLRTEKCKLNLRQNLDHPRSADLQVAGLSIVNNAEVLKLLATTNQYKVRFRKVKLQSAPFPAVPFVIESNFHVGSLARFRKLTSSHFARGAELATFSRGVSVSGTADHEASGLNRSILLNWLRVSGPKSLS